jgi:hypothetical protein
LTAGLTDPGAPESVALTHAVAARLLPYGGSVDRDFIGVRRRHPGGDRPMNYDCDCVGDCHVEYLAEVAADLAADIARIDGRSG